MDRSAETPGPETSPSRTAEKNEVKLFVVAIGASAGGLEALERFFRSMPTDSGMAFVVIQHLSPDFKSLMDELLARQTRLPIHRVQNGMLVEANHVYLLPPKKEMIISEGRLLLTDKDPDQELSLPIDHFFRSLAQDVGRRAIAIVLSGTGSDGSRGIRDVHEVGGLVLAQSEDTAKFDGMPKSAADTGIVDCILPPEDMPQTLVDYINKPGIGEPCEEPAAPHADRGVDAIFKLLRDEYSIDFSHYKPNTVARRIERRLSMNQSVSLDEYVERLRHDPGELNSLYRDLLIGVTRFFRDRDAFERLERDILPDFLRNKRSDEEIRIWVAGCATGEEPYSLAILLHERLEALGRPLNVKVFAGDVHRASLDLASSGIYPAETLSDVTPSRLDRYFSRRPEGYQVVSELRQMIVFARHNVLRDAPFTKLDLISCRNLLIYFQPAAQKKVLSLFHFGLKTGGVLFLGPSESPGELSAEFESLDDHWKIYRKRRDIRLSPDLRLPLSLAPAHARWAAPSPGSGGPDASLLQAYDRLLDDHMPPGLLVTDRRQLIHAFGGAGRFLRYRDGRPASDILDLVDSDLKLALAGALQRAAKDQAPVVYKGLRIHTENGEQHLKLAVKPLLNQHANLTHLYIALETLDSAEVVSRPTELHADDASREHVDSLETELRYTRENLQATIEELETSNEELQASNEELVASNEELQSTNEELHSVNEELYTVNAEYQKKIAELTELTDDMDNLLRSTDIGTIFLDCNLCIRKFTPQIARTIDLLPQDIGRRIDSFTHSIRHAGLMEDLSQVLQTGQSIEREVQDRQGNWFFLRVLPYRSHFKLDGVVLSLIDISSLRQAEARLAQLSAIVESSDDAIISTDLDGKILTWNHGAETLYGYTSEEAVGQNIAILSNDPQSEQRQGWPADTLERMKTGQPIERRVTTVRRRKDGETLHVLLSFSPVLGADGQLVGVSSIARDVTKLQRVEEAIRRSAQELASTNQELASTNQELASTNQELRKSMALRREAEQEAHEAVRRRDHFLAMLSHELRNPLAALVSAATLLDGDATDATTRQEAVGAISRQSRHMARLLDDLLDVSRITRDQIEIRRRLIDLRETARDAVETVRSFAAQHSLELNITVGDEALCVNGDPTRLQQVQVNLLMNAIKYTPPRGRVWLKLARENDEAVIRIRDTGVGIPPEMQKKIFDLFVQLDEKPGRSEGGMGVGLTLVRALVELHGGTVSVHSNGENQGSEFIVRLPAADGPLPPVEKPSLEQLTGIRVLLVEDMADIRAVTSKLLEVIGCEVRTESDGEQGVAAILEQQPDVSLIDIGLPDIDGYEVARRIRQAEVGQALKLIAVTGFGRKEDHDRALAAGFDAHLVKPVDIHELARLLGELATDRDNG